MEVDSVVAGFRVKSLLGQGATGSVYLAEDTGTSERVALKVLAPELAHDERFRRRFLRESQLAASLDSPNAVQTIGSGEEEGLLYLAMAYVEGPDLRHVLQAEGRLEPARAVAVVAQVAEALDIAHEAGLVHRDVKPGNILIQQRAEGEHAFVCDFGLARHVSSVSSLTGDRGFVGTVDYVPPEQIEGGTIDGRADVYSLGCVLYECLGGRRPFERESELSVVFAHLHDPPPAITAIRPELPVAFDEVFATALAKDPDARYATCGELAAAARAALEGRPFVRTRRRRTRLIAAAVILAVAGGVGAGVGLAHGGGGHIKVTITPTSIGGVSLGLPPAAYTAFGTPPVAVDMKYPPNWAMQRFQTRDVNVYYVVKNNGPVNQLAGAHAIEITTWNRADRTAAGVGPCSTVAQLKAAYGSRLTPQSGAIIEGKVGAYLLGKTLLFAIGGPPYTGKVSAVALYRGQQHWAGYNAINDGVTC